VIRLVVIVLAPVLQKLLGVGRTRVVGGEFPLSGGVCRIVRVRSRRVGFLVHLLASMLQELWGVRSPSIVRSQHTLLARVSWIVCVLLWDRAVCLIMIMLARVLEELLGVGCTHVVRGKL
jgi:hypothetical protein